jgi:hypothetical protein
MAGVPHPDEPALVVYVAEYPSATALAVYDASDPAAAGAALRAAAAQIHEIRHPGEPGSALPNWCEVLDEDGVPVLHLDMKDEIRYAALVVRIVLDRLAAAGVDGRLAARRQPDAASPYDANADLYSGMQPLTDLDGRGLPPGFPDGFPVPDEATVAAVDRPVHRVPRAAARVTVARSVRFLGCSPPAARPARSGTRCGATAPAAASPCTGPPRPGCPARRCTGTSASSGSRGPSRPPRR